MITLEKEPFLQAIRAIKTSCGKATLNPILSTIHLKTQNGYLSLTATDLDNSAKTLLEANITEDVDICVNADKLESVISRLNKVLTLEIVDAFLRIKSENATFDLIVIDVKEFPEPDFRQSDNNVTLNGDMFLDGITKSLISVAQGEIHNSLGGVCLTLDENNFELAATDGNRLSCIKYDVPVHKVGQYVLPKKILFDLIKVIGDEVKIHFIQMGMHEKVMFETNGYVFLSNLVNGTFPKYQQLIPTNQPLKAEFSKKALIDALEKVSIMSNQLTNITIFIFTEKDLNLFTECDNGKAKDTITITANIENELKTAFNFKFILDALKVMAGEIVTVNMSGKTTAFLFENDNFTYLVMPVNIQE